ncbi:hypothetical protein ACFV97_12180 [Streptomyces sp. NPDC059913]|uniref:hypothetical protein n=1 Tax=unclassified Streptomyces TaxID=2593676 RepID=UPI0036633816
MSDFTWTRWYDVGTDERDELVTALVGDLPSDDGSCAARYEAAERDLVLLREQMHRIGDRLALEGRESGRAAVPAAHARPRRIGRRRALVLAACGAVVACTAGIGALWLAAQPDGEVSAKLDEVGMVSCARIIVDGTVIRTEPAGADVRVVLRADRYLKPEQNGTAKTEFIVPSGEEKIFQSGDRLVVSISKFEGEPVQEFMGADREEVWERLSAALPESRSTPCHGPR